MAPYKLKKPARIFCGSTIEMFHQNIHGVWLTQIIKVIEDNPQHTFLFLYHFSPHRGIFPDNCWLGLTVTSYRDGAKALKFSKTYPHHIKFISFEPLLGDPQIPEEVYEKIQWMIIGAESGNRKGKVIPKKEWIFKLLKVADRYSIPVFMKGNLQQYWHHYLRRDFHKEKMNDIANERWNENIETCSDCGIQWKKRGKSCPVCYAPAEDPMRESNSK